MDFERCLPNDSKLDNYFELDMDVFTNDVDERRADHAGNDLLDSNIEFDTFETVAYFDTLTHQLLGTFIDERNKNEDSDETHEAVYRAMVFAYQIGVGVHDVNTGLNAPAYLAALIESSPDPKERFERDVHDYLAENPHIDAFLGMYVDDLDEGRNQLQAIELAAGMTFMLIERRIGELFVNNEFEHVTPQDIQAGI